MSARRLALWFGGAFVLTLLLALPLQLVLPRLPLPPGLAAAGIDGSLWHGGLRGLSWRGAAFGDVRAGLAPLPLLAGRQRIRLAGDQARLALETGRLRGVDDAHGVFPLPALHGLGLRASLEDARLLFDGDGCREAGGRVRIEVALPGDALPPLLLAGSAACQGRTGLVALASEDPAAPLGLDASLAIEADGRYTLQTLARSDDPAVRAVLLAAGFQDAPGGLSRVDSGRLGR